MLGSGDEAITYRKAELKTFVALGVEDKLADDELSLLGSVLEFSEKEVSAIMVSLHRCVVSNELMKDTH
jgi:metal transporter CNNM